MIEKSCYNYNQYVRAIKNMEKSNLKIIDTLKKDTNDEVGFEA